MSLNIKGNILIALSRPNPIKYLVAKVLIKTGLSPFVTIYRDGYRLKFFPSNISFTLWAGNSATLVEDEKVLSSVLRPGDTYVDVGANIGALAIFGKTRVGSKGRVVAIEAHPKIFNWLKQNVELNDLQISLNNVAVGEESDIVCFSDGASDDMNFVTKDELSSIRVPLKALDEVLLGEKHIRLLKVDVEGYELFVFRGSKSVLRKTEIVYFESWDKHAERFSYESSDLISAVEGMGFRVYRFTKVGLEPVSKDFSADHCQNLIGFSLLCSDKKRVIECLEAPDPRRQFLSADTRLHSHPSPATE